MVLAENTTETTLDKRTTKTVVDNLSESDIQEAFARLQEQMIPTYPPVPDLWEVAVSGHRLWGLFEPSAGPGSRDLLTLLLVDHLLNMRVEDHRIHVQIRRKEDGIARFVGIASIPPPRAGCVGARPGLRPGGTAPARLAR